MRQIIVWILMMLLACTSAGAQQSQPMADLLDERIRRLGIMSQQDEVFEGLIYNNGYLSARGCQPISVANSLIALLGIEDRETAAGVISETAEVLVVSTMRGKGRVELTRMPILLDAQARAAEAEQYPYLARAIGGAALEINVPGTQLEAGDLEAHFDGLQLPALLVGRRDVYPDWTPLIGIVGWLHEMGMDDALVSVASVSAGRGDSGTPLGSGKGGHYLSLLIHVGSFMQEGCMYVLDSLPRALQGEKSGYTLTMHTHYPFAQRPSDFSSAFDAARISDTVIRLTQRDAAAWAEAEPAQKAQMLKTLILYGPGVLLIYAPAQSIAEE